MQNIEALCWGCILQLASQSVGMTFIYQEPISLLKKRTRLLKLLTSFMVALFEVTNVDWVTTQNKLQTCKNTKLLATVGFSLARRSADQE